MSFDIAKYPTLALVDSTQELRLLPKESLPKLCDELRRYLLDSVSRSSGHFASGLGTVELTVALHYVYNTPFDQLIWDVGHQAYPHKILTGRRDKIGTIRQKGGLHPFPWRGESEYDVLSVGHSSTSISAGIGIAVAAEKENKQRRTVCVIGDGAITAGMAFEAMNHAGDIKPDMLVILNDNEMSISENVGALNNHLAQLLSGKLYSSLREGGKKVFSGVPPIKELLKRTEEHIKGMVVPGTLFEELGFNYIGPVDGHDVLGLVTTLKNMRDLKGPQFLHIMTKKGRGYEPAEKDPITFHAVPKFDPSSGCLPKSSGGMPSYSKIFGDWLCETAAKDNKLMAITPAMREGSGMVEFSRKYPDQYFDVAIAEQHAVTFAAGLAIGGYKPVDGPSAVRYPRGNAVGVELQPLEKLPIGKGVVKRRGEKVAILNFGTLMPEAAKAAEALNATLVDMRFVKPLDESLILNMAETHDVLVTLEENAIMGGAGSGVNEVLMANRKAVPVLNLGLPDRFIPQGTQDEARAAIGLDAAGIEAKIRAWLD
ncbi:hypothetical protein L1887_43827 [Cichorium endivia]|nr:hypothetical protein L1887_43827 [Cichorium endivia]